MTATELVTKMSQELGKTVTLGRLYRYEERGIIPPPMRDKEGKKLYSQGCYDRVLKTVILSELGFHTNIIRAYNLGNSPEIGEAVKKRVKELACIALRGKTVSW